MLNLHQLNKVGSTKTNTDAQHFLCFSVDFRAPSNFLDNIGEPLDYSQSEQLHEDVIVKGWLIAGDDLESVGCLDPIGMMRVKLASTLPVPLITLLESAEAVASRRACKVQSSVRAWDHLGLKAIRSLIFRTHLTAWMVQMLRLLRPPERYISSFACIDIALG